MTTAGFLLVVAITLAAIAFVWAYFDEPGASNFESDGSVRPLLVLTLIIAMLGFGGILIVRALFAPESFDKISERFRLAREIFLVFAGTFSTIVGFYFGSETNNDDADTAPTVEVGYAENRITATVSGGTAPFIGIYRAAGLPTGSTMEVDGRLLTYPVAGGCSAGAEVEVVDGRGNRTQSSVECEDESTEGNTGAGTTDTTGGQGTNATDKAADAAPAPVG